MQKRIGSKRAQGAIEYLLIIGAAILVVAIVILAMTGAVTSAKADANSTRGDYNSTLNELRDLENGGGSGSPSTASFSAGYRYAITIPSGNSGTLSTLFSTAPNGTYVSRASPALNCTKAGGAWPAGACTTTVLSSGENIIVSLYGVASGFVPNLANFTSATPETCTGYNYTDSACQPGGTATRTFTGYSPPGCLSNRSPETVSCTYYPPCTSYNYAAWGPCMPDSTQSRTIISTTPASCSGGATPVTTQSCTYSPAAGNDFTILSIVGFQDETMMYDVYGYEAGPSNKDGGLAMVLRNNTASAIQIVDIKFNDVSVAIAKVAKVGPSGIVWREYDPNDPTKEYYGFPFTFNANETATVGYDEGWYLHDVIGAPGEGMPVVSGVQKNIKVYYDKGGVTYVQDLGVIEIPIENNTVVNYFTY